MSGNWIDRNQYDIISHRKIYMDSVAEVPPVGLLHATADNVTDHATSGGDIGHQAHATKTATTNAERFCSITIKPNMVMKQIKAAVDSDGDDIMNFNANANEEHTSGPWSYDNIDPKQVRRHRIAHKPNRRITPTPNSQNIWAIVTTSDKGHDQLDPSHAVRFTCERINRWRDPKGDQYVMSGA